MEPALLYTGTLREARLLVASICEVCPHLGRSWQKLERWRRHGREWRWAGELAAVGVAVEKTGVTCSGQVVRGTDGREPPKNCGEPL